MLSHTQRRAYAVGFLCHKHVCLCRFHSIALRHYACCVFVCGTLGERGQPFGLVRVFVMRFPFQFACTRCTLSPCGSACCEITTPCSLICLYLGLYACSPSLSLSRRLSVQRDILSKSHTLTLRCIACGSTSYDRSR